MKNQPTKPVEESRSGEEVQVNFRCPEELRQRLEEIARQEDRSVSSLIRRMLNERLDVYHAAETV